MIALMRLVRWGCRRLRCLLAEVSYYSDYFYYTLREADHLLSRRLER